MRTCRVVTVGLLLIGLAAVPASGAFSLDYAGAFQCAPNGPGAIVGIVEGDIAFYPGGDGGAGSLFISEGASDTRKELNEVSIPSLVISNDPMDLHTATTLNRWDLTRTMPSLALSGADKLYYARSSGNQGFLIGSVKTDGTGQATAVTLPWTSVMQSANISILDSSAVAGFDKIVVAQNQSHFDLLVYAVNTTTAAKQQILAYTSANHRTGYSADDRFYGAALIPNDDDSILVLSGVLGGANTLLFYNLDDILTAPNLYSAQPFGALSIEDRIFAPANPNYPHRIYGLTYDSAGQTLYAFESAYGEPGYVHAWEVVPEPATLALLMACGWVACRRRKTA